jgi:hypothetical protein
MTRLRSFHLPKQVLILGRRKGFIPHVRETQSHRVQYSPKLVNSQIFVSFPSILNLIGFTLAQMGNVYR